MHEKCLVLTLRKVQDAHEEREFLERRGWRRSAIENWASEVHQWMDEEGSEVFDDEDGSP